MYFGVPRFETEAAYHRYSYNAQKMKFSIKDFFSKCDQIRSFLLQKSLMENFTFCAVLGKGVLIMLSVNLQENTHAEM